MLDSFVRFLYLTVSGDEAKEQAQDVNSEECEHKRSAVLNER